MSSSTTNPGTPSAWNRRPGRRTRSTTSSAPRWCASATRWSPRCRSRGPPRRVAAMTQVGTVAQLWRYPVKSFQGEQVDELTIAPGGSAGDRILAVVDPAAEKVLSAKRHADLLLAAARLDGAGVVITLPDGSEHAS